MFSQKGFSESMNAARHCSNCEARLSAKEEGNLCAKCGMSDNLPLSAPSPLRQDPPAVASDISTNNRVHYLGDYELTEKLGQGGMGEVWRARQVSLNRPVAVKMILAGLLATDNQARRFLKEAETAASLDHPNIVPIYEVGEDKERHYFSMKLVEGQPLTKVMPQLRTNFRKAVRLLVTVARAIHHAHQRGILHRDIKPGNILIDEQGQPHVTDFGLAKRIEGAEDLTGTGGVVGTPAYMAPEQASGKVKRLTTAVDIYSLGAILYQILTGQPPFKAETPLATLRKVEEEEPKRPSTIARPMDQDLETICLKCLEKEPDKRYGSAEALAEDLERWITHEPIMARPAGTFERAMKWARRKPAVAALTSVLFVSLVLATGVSTLLMVRANRERARAGKAERMAASKAQEAEATLNFLLNEVISTARPVSQGGVGSNITVLQAIELAWPRIPGLLSNQPGIGLRIRESIGATFETLTPSGLELGHVRDRVRNLQEEFGDDHLNTLAAKYDLGACLLELGRNFEAVVILEEVLQGQAPQLVASDKRLSKTMRSLAEAYARSGRLDYTNPIAQQIESELVEAITKQRTGTFWGLAETLDQRFVREHPEYTNLQWLGLPIPWPGNTNVEPTSFETNRTIPLNHLIGSPFVYSSKPTQEVARDFSNTVVTLQHLRSTMGLDHPQTLDEQHKAAHGYLGFRKAEEALALLEDESKRRIQSSNSPSKTLACLSCLGAQYRAFSSSQKQISVREQIHGYKAERLGSTHPATLASVQNLIIAHLDAENFAGAQSLVSRQLELLSKDSDGQKLGTFACDIAGLYLSKGMFTNAIPLAVTAVSLFEKKLGLETTATLDAMWKLSEAYNCAGSHYEAVRIYKYVMQLNTQKQPESMPDSRIDMIASLVDAYWNTGATNEAIEAWGRLVQFYESKLGKFGLETIGASYQFACLQLAAGRTLEAVATLESLLVGSTKIFGRSHTNTRRVRDKLAEAYAAAALAERELLLLAEACRIEQISKRGTNDPILEYFGEAKGEWKAFEEVLATAQKNGGGYSPRAKKYLERYAAALLGSGKLESATLLYEHLVQLHKRDGATNTGVWFDANEGLAKAYDQSGRHPEATGLRELIRRQQEEHSSSLSKTSSFTFSKNNLLLCKWGTDGSLTMIRPRYHGLLQLYKNADKTTLGETAIYSAGAFGYFNSELCTYKVDVHFIPEEWPK